MNAVRAPRRISPASIRWPPNQTTHTEERLTTSMIIGIIPATSRADCRLFRGEVLVGRVEAALFVVLTDEAADDVRADDLLAQHPADPVKEPLAFAVEGNQAAHDHGHDHGEDRDDRDHDPGQRYVLVHGQRDSADEDGGGGDQHGEDQDREVLDLRRRRWWPG